MKRLWYTLIFYSAMACGIAHAGQLTVAITGDGYTNDTQFQMDAALVQQTIMGMAPYNARPQDLKWVIVPNTTTDLGCQVGWLSRILSCNLSAVTTYVSNYTLYNKIIVLVNTPTYGGQGGSTATVCYNGDPRVCAHEFGHTLAGLLDEYVLYGTGTVAERLNKNCYMSTNDSTHYPYVGCNYANWSRAHPTCLMKELSANTFCPICQGLINQAIDSYVAPAPVVVKKGKGRH